MESEFHPSTGRSNSSSGGANHDECQQLKREITALKAELNRLSRIEQQHAEQTAFLQQLISLLPMGIAVHTNGIVTFVNPACIAILNAESADEILGKSAMGFVHPDSREAAQKRIQTLFTAKTVKSTPVAPYAEEKFLRMDGVPIDVEVAAFPVVQPDDDMSVMVLFRDITEQKRQQRLLLEREARFHQLISLLPDATIIHKAGHIIFANDMARRLLKLDAADDALSHSVFDYLHPDEHEKVRRRIQKIMQTGKPLPPENEYLIRSNGETFLAETMAFPFEENGEKAVLIVFRDITERDKMLKALEKSESRFRTLAELLPALVFLVGEDGKLLYINASSQTILGFTPEESRNIDYRPFLHPDFLKDDHLTQYLDIGEHAHYELQVKNKVGQWRWIDVTYTRTIMDDALVGLGVAVDTTWRKETEAILKRQAQKLIKAYEDERGRIARELHDEVGQQLIGMKFALEAAQRFTDSDASQSAIQDARQILADLTENVRELSLSFRPSQLDDLGLLPTLLWHFDRYTSRTGIQVQFSHPDFNNQRFSQAVEITAYRIIQESLTNVARHAQVDRASVTIQASHDRIHITIQDDGVGFNPEEVMNARASSGLSGMKERVELMGGKLEIHSPPGQGSVISATIPLFEN